MAAVGGGGGAQRGPRGGGGGGESPGGPPPPLLGGWGFLILQGGVPEKRDHDVPGALPRAAPWCKKGPPEGGRGEEDGWRGKHQRRRAAGGGREDGATMPPSSLTAVCGRQDGSPRSLGGGRGGEGSVWRGRGGVVGVSMGSWVGRSTGGAQAWCWEALSCRAGAGGGRGEGGVLRGSCRLAVCGWSRVCVSISWGLGGVSGRVSFADDRLDPSGCVSGGVWWSGRVGRRGACLSHLRCLASWE